MDRCLVVHDLLGFFDRFTPKFVKKYADLQGEMQRAFGEYIADVTARRFPATEHTVEMPDEEWELLLREITGNDTNEQKCIDYWKWCTCNALCRPAYRAAGMEVTMLGTWLEGLAALRSEWGAFGW